MHERNLASPPAIVAPAEDQLDEKQLVQGIINAVIRDNFAVGRYALQWCKSYSRTKNLSKLTRLINETNLDADVSESFIQRCAKVAKEFPQRCGSLPHLSHIVAIELDKPNAKAWLEKAEKGSWSCAKLRNEIERKIAPDKMPTARSVKASQRDYAAFKKNFEAMADCRAVRAWIKQHDDLILRDRRFFTQKLATVKHNADLILNAISKASPAGKAVRS